MSSTPPRRSSVSESRAHHKRNSSRSNSNVSASTSDTAGAASNSPQHVANGGSGEATTPERRGHGRHGSKTHGRRHSAGSASALRRDDGVSSSDNLSPSKPSSTASASPSRSRNQQSHRRMTSGNSNNSASQSQAQTGSHQVQQHQQQAPGSVPSNLNPAAGGFQPGTLNAIPDMMNEGLVTPTASHFDLMAGVPRSPQTFTSSQQPGRTLSGNHNLNTVDRGSFSFPQQQQQQQQQQSMSSDQNVAAAQQQHFLQLQQQQQAFQMQQLATLNAANALSQQRFGNNGAVEQNTLVDEANELMAEQLAIQQQLASLRVQQENLLARFGDMQAASLGQINSTVAAGSGGSNAGGAPGPTGSTAQSAAGRHHRRGSSQQQQVGGVMGQFGQGGLGSFGTGSISGTGKGHARRQSATLKNSNVITGTPPTSTAGFSGSPNFSFGAGGSFSGSNNQNNGTGLQHAAQIDMPGDYSDASPVKSHHRRTSGSMSSLGGWQSAMSQQGQANLAEAQAHLQQLAVYRASSGHGRVPSFGMSTFGNGPGQLAMASYGGGLPTPGQSNQPQRKSLFAPYLPQASIPPLLNAGKLVIGVLRVNKRNRSDAYVATDVLESDIYICGSKDRNRALEGDVVAVELLPVDDVWGTKKDKEEKKRKKEESTSYDPRASRDLRKQDKKKDDVEVEGQGLLLFEDEEVNDEQKPQFAGHVVAVVERAPGQLFSGMLGVLRPSSAATQQKQDAERREREGSDVIRRDDNNNRSAPPPKIIWFRPTDKRVPLIAIPTEQAPQDFIDNPDKYADRLFVASIKRWPITSLHPFGTLVEELGVIGDIETETNALLKDCNFTAEDFTESVTKCLPPVPWVIPEREFNEGIRRDMRSHRVFTIDPDTAKDLDDALHIVHNDDGTYEVGVHIADVSYFVKQNTALDREARKRATTVYLIQRAVPMLPHVLSETLCSLNPGSDKLTFSVVFTMTEEGKVLSTWFGRSIINSCAKLAYGDAQEVIEGRPLPAHRVEDEQVRAGIEKDILALNTIARHLRKRRFDGGALRIDNVKVSFKLGEHGLPEDCDSYIRKESNELIEEFMLLANMSVAGKIAAGLPDQALLRRHESPIERRFEAFLGRMSRLGLDLDGSSAGALMKSIQQVQDETARQTLQHLCTKSMLRAKYFCTGMLDISKYAHYALNVPLYTHFTSPIRRYADVLVHRQLEAVLSGGSSSDNSTKFSMDTEAVSKIAQQCNIKKEAARLAQEQSAHLFLCVLVSELTRKFGPVIRDAKVIGVLDQAFDVLVSEFGIEKRVHVDQMPTETTVHDEDNNTLAIYWKKDVDVLGWLAESQNDAHLQSIKAQFEQRRDQKKQDKTQGDGGLTSVDTEAESALFKDDDHDSFKLSKQRERSTSTAPLKFEKLEQRDGHSIQHVKELQTVPVIVTADMTKSPPVLKVLAVNPFA
ncbi:Translational repressor [Microbotryomycetes sp. JL221]|nr:Translational repressor [Microbotryomycetes sp. JL221]